jgi:hypothetical protein
VVERRPAMVVDPPDGRVPVMAWRSRSGTRKSLAPPSRGST